VQVVQETKNLFGLTRFGLVNCFLVREDEGLTLVDTGVAGSAHGIREAAKSLGAAVSRIVLTHAHIDHVGSVDALAREYPRMEFAAGQRESRLLRKDFSLDAGESGKKLLGFPGVKLSPTILLKDGDRIGSLQTIFSPGHTPGHMSYLDVRDGSLIAGDAFTTAIGVLAAGTFKLLFPFPALFSWNREVSAESARKLRDFKPARLAVGHGRTVESPLAAMEQATQLAFQQCGKMLD
jgi:glyoxylase-like metal-dependent hydrolase (beta-lactamase superfamily II)